MLRPIRIALPDGWYKRLLEVADGNLRTIEEQIMFDIKEAYNLPVFSYNGHKEDPASILFTSEKRK